MQDGTVVRNKWNSKLYKIVSHTDKQFTLERLEAVYSNAKGTTLTIDKSELFANYFKKVN
jgi:hypothetical protein